MELSKLLILFLLSQVTYSMTIKKNILPFKKVQSKQEFLNLKYISKDSRRTFFKKSTGGLYMSYNYKSHQLLTGSRTTQFKVITGENESRYILIRDSNYYGLLNMNKPLEIYSLTPSKKRNIPDYVGEGSNIQIHLNEEWISYFKASENKIIVRKLSFPQKRLK